jgi:transcriptional regulator with XRE-family HTH domain
MTPLNRGIIFEKLRSALKARGLKYKDIAESLNVSEPTIKRLFQDKDCKLSRLIEICQILDISIDDILNKDARAEPPPKPMSAEIERKLAENDSLFALLIHLTEGLSLRETAALYNISPASIFLHARELEKLNIIEILPKDKIKILISQPLTWTPNGPLFSQIKKTNLAFLSWVMERTQQEDTTFISLTRTMLPETAQLLQKDLAELRDKFIQLSREDRLLHHTSSLIGYKWSTAFSSTPFDRILSIAEHPNIKKEA